MSHSQLAPGFWLLMLNLLLAGWQENLFIEKQVCMFLFVYLHLFTGAILAGDEANAKVKSVKYSRLSSTF